MTKPNEKLPKMKEKPKRMERSGTPYWHDESLWIAGTDGRWYDGFSGLYMSDASSPLKPQ